MSFSFPFTVLYVVMMLLRPHEWLSPVLIQFQVFNLIMLLAVTTLVLDVLNNQVKVSKNLPHLWLQVGVLFAVVMSHVAHTYLWGVQSAFMEYSRRFIFFMVVMLSCNSIRKIRILAFVVGCMGVVMAYHCHLQATTGFGFGGLEPFWQKWVNKDGEAFMISRSRFVGFFSDPNDVGLFLVSSIPLLLGSVPPAAIPLVLPLAGFIGYGMSTTDSRGGMLAFGVMSILAIAQLFPVKYYVVGFLSAVPLVTFAMPLLATRGLLGAYTLERAIFWGEANYVFKRNPIFGVGYGMLSSDYMEGDRAVHNSFVLVYTELGVFGYFFWFTLVALAFLGSWRISLLKAEDIEDKSIIRFARWMVPTLGGYYTAAYFLTHSYKHPMLLLLAIAGALYNQAGHKIGFDRLNRLLFVKPKTKLWRWFALSLASIAFIYWSILICNKL